MKKTLSVILSWLMLIGIPGFVSFAADDVPEGYTEIYDIEDLYMIRNNLGGKYILMNDIDLTADLAEGGNWNEGMGWTPIGINSTGCEPFTGIFDGNGHTLTGFRINITSI
ncbi:MAG: hypothetical protein IKS04_05665, partial [Clostridia bacterium]|nr:hypothetical protein [Clostridia bacterium]